MMLLTEIERNRIWTTLKVEGWLTSEDCQLLESACSALLERGRTVRLECSRVSYLDMQGAENLWDLGQHGLEIVGWPLFVRDPGMPSLR